MALCLKHIYNVHHNVKHTDTPSRFLHITVWDSVVTNTISKECHGNSTIPQVFVEFLLLLLWAKLYLSRTDPWYRSVLIFFLRESGVGRNCCDVLFFLLPASKWFSLCLILSPEISTFSPICSFGKKRHYPLKCLFSYTWTAGVEEEGKRKEGRGKRERVGGRGRVEWTRKGETEIPCAGLLPKCLEQPGLGQTKQRSSEFCQVLPRCGRSWCILSIICCFPRCISEMLNRTEDIGGLQNT